MTANDPFRHHPGLRHLVTPPEESFFRTFQPSLFDAIAAERGQPPDWRYPDAVRNGMRDAFLANHGAGDLWVFAYGSLMWDPGFRFAEVRRAHLPGFARRFCLSDDGARGTPEDPGVTAALMPGDGCDGLAFRIAAAGLAAELDVVWRREVIAPGYLPEVHMLEVPGGTVPALVFVGDRAADVIQPDLSHAEQVRRIATCSGVIGTNLEYLENLVAHFDELRIADADTRRLLAQAQAHAAARA